MNNRVDLLTAWAEAARRHDEVKARLADSLGDPEDIALILRSRGHAREYVFAAILRQWSQLCDLAMEIAAADEAEARSAYAAAEPPKQLALDLVMN